MSVVAGADGCRGGWVVYCEHEWIIAPTFLSIWEMTRCELLAIDIPIGLAAGRQCDILARQALGPRRSSIFPAPNRRLLGCKAYAEANAMSRALLGVGLSVQAFNLFAKIAEVDRALEQNPSLRNRVFECHPELSFTLLNGEPLSESKKTVQGRALRANLLGKDLSQIPVTPSKVAGPDDFLDAAAAEWTARRIAAGTARAFPPEPHLDERQLRMCIWA